MPRPPVTRTIPADLASLSSMFTPADLPLVSAEEFGEWLGVDPNSVRREISPRFQIRGGRHVRWSRQTLRELTGHSRAPLLRAEQVAQMLSLDVRWVRLHFENAITVLRRSKRWRIEDVESAVVGAAAG